LQLFFFAHLLRVLSNAVSGRDGVAQFFWSKLAKNHSSQVCCVPGKVHFQMPQLALEAIFIKTSTPIGQVGKVLSSYWLEAA
jgi:hypothetical protein